MNRKIIFLATDSMGHGDNRLGEPLLETYFTLLKQREQLPAAIFCANRGVLALTGKSMASLHLKELTERGVPVWACAESVNYYGVGDQLYAGEVSGLDRLIELSERYEVMTIS